MNTLPAQWIKDTEMFWGRPLVGQMGHYCPDWDYMPIDETCHMEFSCCTCDKEALRG